MLNRKSWNEKSGWWYLLIIPITLLVFLATHLLVYRSMLSPYYHYYWKYGQQIPYHAIYFGEVFLILATILLSIIITGIVILLKRDKTLGWKAKVFLVNLFICLSPIILLVIFIFIYQSYRIY